LNILSITAGAADMYCGSCLRDNALAATLMRQGHQVTLLPVYTPTVTDEPSVSAGQRVFFGGISVYLQQHFPLFRRTPWLIDRIWDAPAVIKQFATRSIQVDPRMLGALTVSTLKGEGGYQRKEVEKLVEHLRGEPRPDVVNLPNSMLIALAKPIRRIFRCPIVVTLQGDDLFLEGLPEPYKSESLNLIRSQIDEADLFVSVSEYYTRFMSDYLGIPADRIRTVPLGVNVAGLSAAAQSVRAFTIGYFARIAPEKGLHNLVDAYRILRQERGLPPSRLRAAGYVAAAQRPYLQELERMLTSWGLGGEFAYLGAVDRKAKIRFLRDVDVFSVPTDYHEPKGLFLLEAMACGVPVVEPNHGAFPEMIEKTGGGVLSRSEKPADIADAIYSLWRDRDLAAALGRRGAEGVRAHYTIDHMAHRMADVYRELINAGARSQPSHQNLSVAGR
jgi:glycosyltransferase involved in cell wall biosynthesis